MPHSTRSYGMTGTRRTDCTILVLQTYIAFGARHEMAVKATALLTEFLILLHRGWGPGKFKDHAKITLDEADGDVLHHLATLYEWQGWSDAGKELPQKPHTDSLRLEDVCDFLGQSPYHRAVMQIDIKTKDQIDDLGQSPSPSAMLEIGDKTKDQIGDIFKDADLTLVHSRDMFGRTILQYAAFQRYYWNMWLMMKVMRNDNVDKAVTADRYGMTALHAAAEAGNARLVKVLAGGPKGGIPKDTRFLKRTALHIATDRGHARVVRELLRIKANTSLKAPGGSTALHLAVTGNRNDVVFMLLDTDGFDAVDNLGRTALHLAASTPGLDVRLGHETRWGGIVKKGEEEVGQDMEEKVRDIEEGEFDWDMVKWYRWDGADKGDKESATPWC